MDIVTYGLLSKKITDMSSSIDRAVSDWLDGHPEATTTVEDASITFEKMAPDMSNAQFVKNIAELKETTADYVYVIENDTRVCDICRGVGQSGYIEPYDSTEPFSLNRGGCWYWKHSNSIGGTTRAENRGGYLRDNGDVMFAMPDQGERVANSPEALNGVFDVFGSYYNSNIFKYGATSTMFTETCAADEDGKYMIDCSTLISAVIQGVKMGGSRYILGNPEDNVFAPQSAIRFPSTRGNNFMYLDEMIEYFAENKQLFTLHSAGATAKNITAMNGIMPGDILFSCSPDASSDEQYRWTSYYAVDHAVIVLAVCPEDGALIVGQGGGSGSATIVNSVIVNDTSNVAYIDNDTTKGLRTVKISTVDFYHNVGAGKKYQVFARPAYKMWRTADNISGRFVSDGNVTVQAANTAYRLGYIVPRKPMEIGNCYSLTIKGNLPRFDSDGAYLAIGFIYKDISGTERTMPYDETYKLETDGKMVTVPIILPVSDIDKIALISVQVRSPETTGQTYKVTEIALCDGISYGANGSSSYTFTKDSGFANSITNRSFKTGDGVFVDLVFTASGVTNGVLIGKFDEHVGIDNIVVPGSIGRINNATLQINSNGEIRYFTSSTSTGQAMFRGWIA